MVAYLLLGVLLGAFTVVFAMDNSALVTIHVLSWQFTVPIALGLITAMLLGIIITLLAMLPRAVRTHMDAYAIRREQRRADRESTVVAS